MKPIICIAPAPAVEPMFFNDGWMVNKKYFLGVSAGGGVPVMATDIELAEEYARLCETKARPAGRTAVLRFSKGRQTGIGHLPRAAEY